LSPIKQLAQILNANKVKTVVGLSIIVQSLSGLTILIFPLLGPTASDRLAILTQVGMVSFGGVALGLVYNLAIGRPGFSSWAKWSIFTVVVSIVASVIEYVLSSQRLESIKLIDDYSDPWVSIGFGLGGACIGVSGVLGVKRACHKKPFYLSSVTLLPNLGVLVGVLGSVGSKSLLPVCLTWLIGCLVTLLIGLYLEKTSGMFDGSDLESETKNNLWLHALALIIGVVLSSFMPLIFTIALLGLAPGTAYLGALVVRVATAGITLFVNSVLVVKYHWGSKKNAGLRLEVSCALAFSFFALVSLLLISNSYVEIFGYCTYVFGWFAGLIASAFLIREMNARKMGAALLVKVTIELMLNCGLVYQLLLSPSLIGYFAAVSVGQAFTILFGGVVFKSKTLISCGAFSVFMCIILVSI